MRRTNTVGKRTTVTADFFTATARQILQELAATDTMPTSEAIRAVIQENYGDHLSGTERVGVTTAALRLASEAARRTDCRERHDNELF